MKRSPEVIKTGIWKSGSERKEVRSSLSGTGRNGVSNSQFSMLYLNLSALQTDRGGYSRGREGSWEGICVTVI